MNVYQINYYKHIPAAGWIMESERVVNQQNMHKKVHQLGRMKDVRCVDVVRLNV